MNNGKGRLHLRLWDAFEKSGEVINSGAGIYPSDFERMMDPEISAARLAVKQLLDAHVPPLQARIDRADLTEFAGTIPAMQGKQLVDGIYFASIVPKPKDLRFYFFPIYTHPDAFVDISPAMRKCLKGKSCFHFKRMGEAELAALKGMIAEGIARYRAEGWV